MKMSLHCEVVLLLAIDSIILFGSGTTMHIIYWLIAMIGFGLATGIAKHVSRNVWGSQTVLWRNTMGVPVILLLLVVFAWEPIGRQTALLIYGVGVVGYLPLLSFYTSLKYWNVWVLGPLSSTSTLITIGLSLLFLQESLSLWGILGVATIFLGIFLLTMDWKAMKSGVPLKGLLYVWWAIVGRGCIYFFFKIAVDASSPMWTVLLIESWVLTGSILHQLSKHRSLPSLVKDPSLLKSLIVMSVLANIWAIALNYGLWIWPVSVVTALFAWAPLITVFYGVLVYQEKVVSRQWIWVLGIVVGLILISGLVG